MAWEWSHADEAYSNAYENIHNLDRDTLVVILAEWNVALNHGGRNHAPAVYIERGGRAANC